MCIDELEARLLLSDRASNLVDMWSDLINILNCEQLVVTRGRMGMLIGDSSGVKSQIPAMATNIVDPVGAGDAVLAAMSMCRAAALPEKISEIIAISFGALACQIVGNREPVKKAKLKKFIVGWL